MNFSMLSFLGARQIHQLGSRLCKAISSTCSRYGIPTFGPWHTLVWCICCRVNRVWPSLLAWFGSGFNRSECKRGITMLQSSCTCCYLSWKSAGVWIPVCWKAIRGLKNYYLSEAAEANCLLAVTSSTGILLFSLSRLVIFLGKSELHLLRT